METKEQAIEIITKALPYPEHITDWDFSSSEDSVRFTWRGNRFRVDLEYERAEEVKGIMLEGGDLAICVSELIKRQAHKYRVEQDKKGKPPYALAC